jgi:eukaryotic-like serine/threonine-protein kinase
MHLEDTLAILKQLVAGVSAMHDGGVVHRDIKPNNIMLEGSGPDVRLYITDFGLARAHESDVTIGTRRILAGTPAYMAPELFRGAQPSRATDLFALGVVMHQLFLGKKPELVPGSYSVAASSQLSLLDLPPYCIRLVTECLSDDPQRRCRVFDEMRSFLDPRNTPFPLVYRENQSWTRRRFLAIAAGAACAAAGAVWWKNDTLDNLLHPLPAKRFVALLSWPPPSDAHIKPMLAGVLHSIENELSRVEAFDRNLFVTSPLESNEVTSPKQFSEIRDSLGTNLVLAASAALHQQRFHLSLQILDPVSPRPLREKHLSCPMGQETSMPGRAVRAAAELLNVGIYLKDSERTDAGTRSRAAFAAFQAAEALVKQGGDVAVDAAVDEYKRAVELDPHYALAHAQLAIAYLHLYSRRHDPAAISLARGNTETALKLDPDLVEGHLARALLLEDTGDEAGALREYAKALSIDPSNPRTLIYQAQIYDRLNRWEDAEKTYRRVLQERPNYWLAHNELAMVFYAQGKYQEALTEFRSASLAAPRNAMALNNIGATSLQLGNLTEATDSLKKSLELGPSDFAFGSMAAVLRARHKFPEALSFAQRAVKLNPRESLNWLELGDCYSLLGNHRSEARGAYARAADLQEEQLRTNASDGPSWMLLALYKAKAGTPEAAVPLIRKAEFLAAGDIQSQLYKARTLEVLGKRDEALTTIADCLRMGATKFQIESTPDLESLRGDLRYQQISSIGDSSFKTKL